MGCCFWDELRIYIRNIRDNILKYKVSYDAAQQCRRQQFQQNRSTQYQEIRGCRQDGIRRARDKKTKQEVL